jgi:HAD superfamily hydrolase (TIGR01509 family)
LIRCLLFDFGRVISAQKPVALFRSYEIELGLPPASLNRIMFDSPLWEQALVGELQMAEFWQAIGPQLNLDTPAKVDAFRRRYYADEEINQEVVDLIASLAGGYRLGIVSNHPPGLVKWLRQWQILKFFDTVVSSGEVGVVKPNEKIYLIALKRLGIEAADTLFIDDTEEHVLAAQALGMTGHHFSSASTLIAHLEELGIIPRHL